MCQGEMARKKAEKIAAVSLLNNSFVIRQMRMIVNVPKKAAVNLTENSFSPNRAIKRILEYIGTGNLQSPNDLKKIGAETPYSSFPVVKRLYALTPILASSAKNPLGTDDSIKIRNKNPIKIIRDSIKTEQYFFTYMICLRQIFLTCFSG